MMESVFLRCHSTLMAVGVLVLASGCGSSDNGGADDALLVGIHGEGARAEIVTFPVAGGPIRRLSDNDVEDFAPQVSPDGGQIVFVREADSSTYEIWVMDSDGENERRLTSGHEDFAPAWSSDGKSVFFSRSFDDHMEIKRIPAGGGAVDIVLQLDGHSRCAGPVTQSPDGEQLVFQEWEECGRPSYFEGIRVRRGTSPTTDFCDPGGDSWYPDFSPDGKLAIGNGGWSAGIGSLVVVPADCSSVGSEIVRGERFVYVESPHWSPDGDWIAFQSDGGVWIVRSDGTELRKIPGSAQIRKPDWITAG
jgi:Tol biopolymer transport system component